MCGVCGCGNTNGKATITKPGENALTIEAHQHHHGHEHGHEHHHHHGKSVLELEQDILRENQLAAAKNRGYFEAKNILAINFVSSPGSGKTTLLEETLKALKDEFPCYVIEGDQQTMHDANRIDALGIPVIQVNTGQGCHLESDMVYEAVKKLKPKENAFLFIENVGNLVCPSLFDLGESKRVVIISTTEGEDKPIKYPDIFHSADLCIINKIDLVPYLNISVEKMKEYALQVNHRLQFFETSCTTGAGLDAWLQWLREQIKQNA